MNRGDIYNVDLEPTKGQEQQGRRFVMIVSADAFNKHNPPLVCPITTGGMAKRLAGLTVNLQGTGTSTVGVVLCSQIRVLDIRARKGRKIERAPEPIVQEVIDCLHDILTG
jgi:mRNA-degrading endonuclease toxin of MazEF toxin-antitoxin module